MSADNSGVGDIFAASSSGLTRFVVTQNGFVGIGTSNPSTALRVIGTVRANTFQANNGLGLADGATGLYGVKVATNNDVRLFTNGADRFTVDNGGNVGINTTSPLGILDVRGTSGTNIMSGIIPVASISGQTSFAALAVDNSGTGDLFTASSSGLSRFVVTQNGQVGIGTTTPLYSLVAAGSGGNISLDANSGTPTIRSSRAGTNTIFADQSGGFLRFATGGNNTGRLEISTSGNIGIGSQFSSFPNTELALLDVRGTNGTNVLNGTAPVASISGQTSFAGLVVDNSGVGDIFAASSSGLNRFVIKQNGNIGVGTTNPQTLMTINGTLDQSSGGFFVTNIYNHSLGNNARIQMLSTGAVIDRNIADSNPALIVQQTNASSTGDILDLKNSSATVLNVLQTGTIGVNTSSPLGILDVRGVGNQTLSGTIPVASFSGKTSFAALVADNSGSGDIFAASSSGLNRFVITQNGNVGIGTTTPGALLDVNGTLKVAGLATFNGGATVATGQSLTALGQSTFTPDAGHDVTINVDHTAPSYLTLNGLDTSNGSTLCTDASNHVVLCSAASSSLQGAYNGGNTITTSTGRNIAFTLGSGLATQTSFTLTNAGTGEAFVLNDTNGATNTSLDIQSGGVSKLTIDELGNLTTAGNITQTGATTLSTGTGAISLNGATSVTGTNTFTVGTGATTLGGILGVTGVATFNNDLTQTGAHAFSTGTGAISLNGNTTLASGKTLTLTGSTQGSVLYTDGSANVVGVTGTSTQVLHGGTTPSFGAVSLTADVSGILPLSSGGTNANLTADNGGIVWSNGTQLQILPHNANSGLALVSGGGATPSWFAPTQGSIVFAGANGALSQNNNSLFYDNTNNRLGVGGNCSLLGTLDVRTTSGTLPVASVSGATSFASLVVDNSGTGDIFTASSSGLNRFVITNNGNVGIGTTTPSLFALQVAGSIGPDAADAYDLGSASREWNNLYVKNITATGNISQTGSGTFSTGTGAISLNGATSVTGTNTFTVGQEQPHLGEHWE